MIEQKRGPVAKPPEWWQKRLIQLEAAYNTAGESGDKKQYRRLRHQIRYAKERIGEAGLEPLPPGSIVEPALPGGSINSTTVIAPVPAIDFGSLWKEAGEAQAGLEMMLADVARQSGKNLKVGFLSGRVLGMGLILLKNRRIPPQALKNADLILVGAGAGLLVLENWKEFAGADGQNTGGGAERERQDGAGSGEPSGDKGKVDTQKV